jgi:hypothetical protein
MSQASITIGVSCTVPAAEAPALLQKLLAVLPGGVIPTTTATPSTGASDSNGDALPHRWPPIPEYAGEVYRKIAEENLRHLQHGEIPDHGWGRVHNLQEVIGSLRSETRKVVLRAIQNGGHVTRDEVYELLERDKTQSLKGFTKPAANLMERLISSGELPRNARPLLEPIYKQSKTYQQAQGFVVPLQVVSLLNPGSKSAE